MEKFASDPIISGFTTNPSLMKKAGIKDYRSFAKEVLSLIGGKPVSFEVLVDDFGDMEWQAREIASWGENVWVKIPITNTQGQSAKKLIQRIKDLNLNITAVMTVKQIEHIAPILLVHHILSVFVGRIMDAGCAAPWLPSRRSYQLLWASTREIYNVEQAKHAGYDIITLTPDLLAKLPLRGKDLAEYSLETVQQFHNDGKGITF